MKKAIFTALCVSTAAGAFAQGTVTFSNLTGLSPAQPIFLPDGTTKANSADEAQLYYSTSASGPFTAVGTPVAFTGSTGYVIGGTVTLPGVATGSTIFLEIAAWQTSGGSSYQSALAAGVPAEISLPFSVTVGGPSASGPAVPPASLTGFTSSLMCILCPEPSTFALGALGISALFISRRKPRVNVN